EYVTNCLRTWLVRWEQELNRKLLTPAQKGKQFFEFSIDGLLRGDIARSVRGVCGRSAMGVVERERGAVQGKPKSDRRRRRLSGAGEHDDDREVDGAEASGADPENQPSIRMTDELRALDAEILALEGERKLHISAMVSYGLLPH